MLKHFPMTTAIAWRYLVSKKSHGAVATISIVSVVATAVATAAIVCVLSVFNGFREMISDRLDSLQPDVMVSPSHGKVFPNAEALAAKISKIEGVALASPSLSDNALAIYDRQEMPVEIKGVVAQNYDKITQIRSLVDPELGTYHGLSNPSSGATIAIGTASRLNAMPGEGLLLFAPRREGRLNPANPLASFTTDSVTISGIYRTDQAQFDDNGVILPLSVARGLLQYNNSEASAIEVKAAPGVDTQELADRIENSLGPNFEARNRLRQQAMNFRMIEIEKWVSFLLLGFILIIAGFNIISSLSMLVLEKEKHLAIYAALGMSKRRIGHIFAWESIFVAAAGGIAGVILGVAVSLLQQHAGVIKITNSFDPERSIPYPVVLEPLDALAALIPVFIIGLITAAISARFARSRIS